MAGGKGCTDTFYWTRQSIHRGKLALHARRATYVGFATPAWRPSHAPPCGESSNSFDPVDILSCGSHRIFIGLTNRRQFHILEGIHEASQPVNSTDHTFTSCGGQFHTAPGETSQSRRCTRQTNRGLLGNFGRDISYVHLTFGLLAASLANTDESPLSELCMFFARLTRIVRPWSRALGQASAPPVLWDALEFS